MARTTHTRSSLVAAGAILLGIAFLSGFTFHSMLSQHQERPGMKKVTGIGGVFFKCKDPKALKEWYKTHLGMQTNDYGATFEWREEENPDKKGSTTWGPFAENTKYFEPSAKDFMINYRVDDLEGLVEELKREGVTVIDTIAVYDYGKFVHIMDVEGNKVELWEPRD